MALIQRRIAKARIERASFRGRAASRQAASMLPASFSGSALLMS